MSVECGICERDLRGGHAEYCPRYTPPIRCKSCGGRVLEKWRCEDCGQMYHDRAQAPASAGDAE